MPKLFILTLSLLPWIPAFLCKIRTDGEHEVLEGESLMIPCHYEPQYAGYVKYWCRGNMRDFCTSLVRSDDTHPPNPDEDKVSFSDDPVQQVFTVSMKNLKEADSGWYMCGVEIGSVWSRDVITSIHIKVVHGISVVNSHVSGEEGSSVTVECLYSERYRESEKKWCRSGNWTCLLTGTEGSYEDTSVTISDDRTRTFTVTIKKLQLKDAGWYWCSSGHQKTSVYVQVTPRPSTTTVSMTSPLTPSQSVEHLPPPKSITKESWNSHSHILESLLVCASLMLLVGMVILAIKLWKQRSPRYPFLEQDPVLRQVREENARISYSGDVEDLENVAVIFPNKGSQGIRLH
ncbi:Polymeric immunoglobulin receptor [Larimichthys crocea]|uniref:Uncharacterized protein n=1 Tax=Larimichthys crocea TaxID=215358 RepID=A0ACD3QST2_LARCR|nr:Polymeric immunoglobulin receptor [Larimichthys crocea]TMS09548.1 Polymeric immunoglobulin receptor [Larimichthys crocea]